MSSNINYAPINKDYPVAGVDNDSQGFRDNFTAIYNALQVASSEISALQNVSVLKADLATQSNPVDNDLQGSTIFHALYNQFYGVFFNAGTSQTIDLENGPAQKLSLAGTLTPITFKNWPESGYAVVRVMFIAGQNATIASPIFATENSGNIHYDVNFPSNLNVGGESVSYVQVTDPGSGYITSAEVNFISPPPNGILPVATATYKVISAAPVGGQAGSGFTTNTLVVVNQQPSVILNVTGIGAGGAITSLSVASEHELTIPLVGQLTVTALTGSGDGAAVTVNCGVKNVVVSNPGDGYSTAPTVTIDTGSSSRALGTAHLTSNTANNVKVIEAWTVDGGTNVYIRYIGEFH